jgi:hypothetical protein
MSHHEVEKTKRKRSGADPGQGQVVTDWLCKRVSTAIHPRHLRVISTAFWACRSRTTIDEMGAA